MKPGNKIYIFGLVITLFHLFIHIAIIRDYPVAWDYHYHHYAGLYHLGLPVPSVLDQPPVPFTPPDPRLTIEDPFGPFTQIIPSLFQAILSDKLNLLTFDVAYNLPIVIIGSVGVGVLFVFIAQSVGFWVGLFSALFLSLLPVYFGYVHTSMKDVGNAAAFAVAIWAFWRLIIKNKMRNLIYAVASFAVAFNIKINSVVIPVVCGIWYVTNQIRNLKFKSLVLAYFILAPFAAVALWLPFWKEPLKKILELPYFYSHNTLGMPVLLFGQIYRSGINIPFTYPWIYIGVSVPAGIIILSILGAIIAVIKSLQGKHVYTLILLWLFVPLLRYSIPSAGAIDGMRHFLEIAYPLSVLAACGWYAVLKIIIVKWGKIPVILVSAALFTQLVNNVVHYHPYQTSFFNVLIGGINGAREKFDIDFWGTPQKQAISWINDHAPYNSFVYIAMAQSSAAMYAREDLRQRINSKSIWHSDYVVVLNRQSFFEFSDLKQYLDTKKDEGDTVYSVTIDGVPLVTVFKNRIFGLYK